MLNRLSSALVVLALSVIATGCNGKKVTSVPNVTGDRSRRLSVLAATEAGRIQDPDARLTRQLNIADQVQHRYGAEDALAVLDEASKTLREVGPALDGYTRISGWVSVSQLARKAAGTAAAESATKAAQAALEALPETGERCQYVLGVAEEVSHLQGDAQAVALLIKGGQWAKGIDDAEQRRAARLAFAIALFNLNAFEGGVESLRGEDDPAWSSDTMLALASREPSGSIGSAYAEQAPADQGSLMNFAAPTAAAPAKLEVRAPQSDASYGRSLGYDKVFRGATHSRH